MWLNTSRGHLPLHCSWLFMKFAKFQSVKNKAPSKRSILCHDTTTLPSPRLNNLSFWERKYQLGVSRMGICVQRYIKYLKCHSFSRNFFKEKSKKDRRGGTQERKIDARKQRKGGKTTVNSVNPSCSSALKLYSLASIFFQFTPSIHNSHRENSKTFHSEWIDS